MSRDILLPSLDHHIDKLIGIILSGGVDSYGYE